MGKTINYYLLAQICSKCSIIFIFEVSSILNSFCMAWIKCLFIIWTCQLSPASSVPYRLISRGDQSENRNINYLLFTTNQNICIQISIPASEYILLWYKWLWIFWYPTVNSSILLIANRDLEKNLCLENLARLGSFWQDYFEKLTDLALISATLACYSANGEFTLRRIPLRLCWQQGIGDHWTLDIIFFVVCEEHHSAGWLTHSWTVART